MSPKKSKASSGKLKTPTLSKSQIRSISELEQLYRKINEHSLREEAYAVALQAYIQIRKKGKSSA